MFNCFKRNKRKNKFKGDKVIMHCAATPDSNLEDSRWFDLDISEIREWHKARGWRDVGYHYFIKRDGTVQKGRPVGTKGAHTLGHNDDIGVCYAGYHKPTELQKDSIRALALEFRADYGLSIFDWHCHNEYANKDCPGFDVIKLRDILKDKE